MSRNHSIAAASASLMIFIFACSQADSISTLAGAEKTNGPSILGTIQPNKGVFDPTKTRIAAFPDPTWQVFNPPVPEGAKARLGAGDVRYSAVSKDWSKSAIAINKQLILCDQDACRILPGADETIRMMMFSNDGTKLATMGDLFSLWDIKSDKLINTFPLTSWNTYLDFSDDGQTIALSEKADIFLFDGNTGENIGNLAAMDSEDYIYSLDISPDNKSVAAGVQSGVINIWDMGSRSQLYTYSIEGDVASVRYSTDGTKLATSTTEGAIRVWNTNTKEGLFTIDAGRFETNDLQFSPDGKILSSNGTSTKFWDAAKGTLLHSMISGFTYSSSFSDDGKYYTAMSGSTLLFWEVESGELVYKVEFVEENLGWMWGLAFSPDGKYFASISAGQVVLWDTASNTERLILDDQGGEVVAFSADSSILASGSERGEITLWNVENGERRTTLSGHTRNISGLSFSPDGTKLLSGSNDGTAILWNIADGEMIYSLSVCEECGAGVTDIAFSPDGRFIAIGVGDDSVLQCDAESGDPIYSHTVEEAATSSTYYHVSVVFSPDGSFLMAGSPDNMLRLWDTATGKSLDSFDCCGYVNEGYNAIAISPDGKYFAAATQGFIQLYEFSTRKHVKELVGHDNYVYALAFSADSKTLLSGSGDGTIILWDVALIYANWNNASD